MMAQQQDPLEVEAVPDTASMMSATEESVATGYAAEDVGETKTLEWRRFLTNGGARVSSWHDVPLFANKKEGTLNAVIEITRCTQAKMEMATKEEQAPIKQDVKKGKLRDYIVPIEWNYGAFPQTWEQPDHAWAGLEALATKGDNDPLDLVDLSKIDVACGSVIQVKLVGVLAMIDEGEVDWKMVVINVADPLADKINSLEDAEVQFPGEVGKIREWFTWYKSVDGEKGDGPLGSNKVEGKEPNVFGFDGVALDATKALEVVEETHAAWAGLVTGATAADGLSVSCGEAAALAAKGVSAH